ncbi:hypothetical protein HDU93_000418 [Gonapodya sp. JEL0774]|nr:hypothetical protein HDU93_000418 [Gonapodya sp. JEL0774]
MPASKTFSVALLMLVAALGLVRAATVAVANQGLTFVPKDVSIAVGDTVTWTITGSHSVTQSSAPAGCSPATGGFDSGVITGATYSFTFNSTGTFSYYCVVGSHCSAGMVGTVTVAGAAAPASSASSASAPATSAAASAPATSAASAATSAAAAPATSAAASKSTTAAAATPSATGTAKAGSAFKVSAGHGVAAMVVAAVAMMV